MAVSISVFTARVGVVYLWHAIHLLTHLKGEDGNDIAENEYEPSTNAWSTNILLSLNVLGYTSLAALAYFFNGGLQLQVYYQTADLSLAEYCWSDNDWFAGQSICPAQSGSPDHKRNSPKATSRLAR